MMAPDPETFNQPQMYLTESPSKFDEFLEADDQTEQVNMFSQEQNLQDFQDELNDQNDIEMRQDLFY